MTHDPQELMDAMAGMYRASEPFALATIVRTEDATSAKAGAKALVREDGDLVGWIGGGCTQGAVKKAAKEAIGDGRSRLIRVRPAADVTQGLVEGIEQYKSVCPSGGTVEVFIEPMLPRPALVIMGGSPCALALAEMGRAMGYSITVAALPDDQASFPAADRRFEDLTFDDEDIPASAFIVVATQGKRDRVALAAALASAARYVAFIGSRRKGQKLKDALLKDGLEKTRLARLHCPAGLDIGAITPGEIALSILGEITQLRRRDVRGGGKAAPRIEEIEGGSVETSIVGETASAQGDRTATG